jgi:hypothetical protein
MASCASIVDRDDSEDLRRLSPLLAVDRSIAVSRSMVARETPNATERLLRLQPWSSSAAIALCRVVIDDRSLYL